ncbi:hypothetical protein [Bosea lupini]|uniref:hypothetical protein n=1 Tax=Bosea lupini TaxID=1036779 RepID=UPI000B87F134|nr:hypothetical protein [Bosea lupini]
MNEACANIKIEHEARHWVFLPPMRPSQQRRIALTRRFVSYPNLGQHLLWFASPPAQASRATDPQQANRAK